MYIIQFWSPSETSSCRWAAKQNQSEPVHVTHTSLNATFIFPFVMKTHIYVTLTIWPLHTRFKTTAAFHRNRDYSHQKCSYLTWSAAAIALKLHSCFVIVMEVKRGKMFLRERFVAMAWSHRTPDRSRKVFLPAKWHLWRRNQQRNKKLTATKEFNMLVWQVYILTDKIGQINVLQMQISYKKMYFRNLTGAGGVYHPSQQARTGRWVRQQRSEVEWSRAAGSKLGRGEVRYLLW